MAELTPAERNQLISAADVAMASGRYDEAAEAYERLLEERDLEADNVVKYYEKLIRARSMIGDFKSLQGAIDLALAVFDPSGPWWQQHGGSAGAVGAASRLVRDNVRFLAVHLYSEARRAESAGERKADERYREAAKYCRIFLERFPGHRDECEVRFIHARVLHVVERQMEQAAHHYEAVRDLRPTGENVEEAAAGVVLTLVSLRDQRWHDEEAGVRAEPPPGELTSIEARLMEGVDSYVEVVGAALRDDAFRRRRPTAGERMPILMFLGAETLVRRGRFVEAAARLDILGERFPAYLPGDAGVAVVLDAYAKAARWKAAEAYALRLITAERFETRSRRELSEIIVLARSSMARQLSADGRFRQAIEVLWSIVRDYGTTSKRRAAAAQYNIGALNEARGRQADAVAAYAEVLRRFPTTNVATLAREAADRLGRREKLNQETTQPLWAMHGRQLTPSSF